MSAHFNCLTYALGRWCSAGGYVVILKSPRWKGIHALWSRDLRTFFEYIPTQPRRRARLWHVLWFNGYVKEWKVRQEELPHAPERRVNQESIIVKDCRP